MLLAWSLAGAPARADEPRPADARGVAVVPDEFLRSWDPVTIFFPGERADAAPGASRPVAADEGAGPAGVRLEPPHPGAWTWLDARTLQFRPAEPWPALERFRVTIPGGDGARLATLMAPPVESVPADGAVGVERLEELVLTFAEPIDPGDLARGLTIELRPLPGVGAGDPGRRGTARWLDARDFTIKERAADGSARASYVVRFDQPLPLGRRVLVHLQRALAPLGGDEAGRVVVLDVSTAEPFRVVAAGCGAARWPIAPSGSMYPAEQALRCSGEPELRVDLSAPLAAEGPHALGPLEARNLVRTTPAVDDLTASIEGRTLVLRGDFARDTLYRVGLEPLADTTIHDARGRPLELRAPSALHVVFPAQPAYLRWDAGRGLVERRGPQMAPVVGRADARADLRVHRVDPLDVALWPFPDEPLAVDETARPPGPGEDPAPADPRRAPRVDELVERLRALGGPVLSEIVDLPLRADRGAARFGLDLEPWLDRAFGADAAGHYLVGLRRLDGSPERTWMRVQSSDLAVTVVEEPRRVVFAVTSLDSARPIAGATVRVEGLTNLETAAPGTSLDTLWTGTTDARGLAVLEAPGRSPEPTGRMVQPMVRRLVVESPAVTGPRDVLVLDAARPPDRFADGAWTEWNETWLQWAWSPLGGRGRPDDLRAHLFTERPVYRPEEPVHFGAILRRSDGRGGFAIEDFTGVLVIDGPGGRVWREPVETTADGWIVHRFDADDTPAGVYRARLERQSLSVGAVTFRKEAYRLPRFEVLLDAPRRAPLDAPFEVEATASYYAGGRVAERPVRWRVTQFPYRFEPPTVEGLEGFVWSSGGRFSRTEPFQATPATVRVATTDAEGGAVLTVDPTIEPTAQPRTYVVEATVTGADDQTVTSTRRVVALPPFVLGVAVPRYLEPGAELAPRVVVIDADGEPIAGSEVTVRLLHRQWHSHLQASDFTDGVARYVTEVVDEPVLEKTVTTSDGPLTVELPTADAGVYVVEVSARDRLGRTQVVAVDVYAASGREGTDVVTWAKPSTPVLGVSADAESYRPGDVARLVLESPFQEARALVALEAPEGVRYSWHDVRGGEAVIEVPIETSWAPRVAVHVALLRGRLEGVAPRPGNAVDLGRPTTLAATHWLEIEPVDRRVEVTLEHPPEALPGQDVEMTVRLSTPDGAPLAGTVALWLVDRAVLALGEEQRLDPLPTFVTAPGTYVSLRDTRGMVFGLLPLVELPGGGEGAEKKGLLDRQTVRKNFEPVPYFERLEIPASGELTVRVPLPDNLTTFAVRAKATSGADRFGSAKSTIDVRLPVLVQPALPRFVRPGDAFRAGAVARLVSGPPGAGRLEVALEGVELANEDDPDDDGSRDLQLLPNRAARIDVPVRVPLASRSGEDAEAVFRVGVERLADGVGDAFEVRLPILADVRPEVRRELVTLEAGGAWTWPALDEPARAGTVRRSLLVSDRPSLIAVAAGLDVLLDYPYGCTEQRVSRARALVALRRFVGAFGLEAFGLEAASEEGPVERRVRETLAFLDEVTDDAGFVAYWPGGETYVSLTSWVVELEAEAQAAGFEVDEAGAARRRAALERALRSDFGGFVPGASWSERTMALRALAVAGRAQPAYAAELSSRAEVLGPAGVARVLQALAADPSTPDAAQADELVDLLWRAVVFRRADGERIFGGFTPGSIPTERLILPSEARTLAETVRALERVRDDGGSRDDRLEILIEGLVRLGAGDGWGETQANAAALLALAEQLEPSSGSAAVDETLRVGGAGGLGGAGELSIVDGIGSWRGDTDGAIEVVRASRTNGTAAGPLAVKAETRFVPATPAAELQAEARGFVVERRLALLGVDARSSLEAARKVALDVPGTVELTVGEVVEEHIRLVNPEDRVFVALVVPLAAGVEVLNPSLATAPPEARPSAPPTIEPTYVERLDDRVAYYFDVLPKGTFDFRHRVRASVAGSFSQPPALAESMYDRSTRGRSAGARVEVVAPETPPTR